MNLRDFGNSPATTGSYTVTLTLNVEDSQALWTAAADKALQAGMALSDVLDTIGPREDPAIMDCIAMLTAPGAIAGCALDEFDVSIPASAELVPLTGRPLLRSVAG
ncbi:hypothetical protein MZO42_07230 [Sphingomonas psychrotolerans]|uniref:Uncharacterized protein n=1 Tax=Sphingomonas psychrotolerans TaxID=1327635 RepID=A0ABU3N1R6_9SPHN|nr:hypothetical protein [Sphingomonas psychrotolerans]MDT8758485.1 hypothetical protein [Sphingomonas psychrotolerans]